MLIRITLIVAIVAALAVGALNFFVVKEKITALTTDRDSERGQKVEAQTELASTKKDLSKTKADLAQTQTDLNNTKTERDQAVATAAKQTQRADDLSDKLAKTSQERDAAQNDLAAYKATGFDADQVGKLARSLKDAQDTLEVVNGEKVVLQRAVTRYKNELAKFVGDDPTVRLRADLKGKIVVVDPKWDFVVLNIGEDQGVLQDGELLVSRDGKLVAKVIVRSVEKGRSIANIVPGWKLGEVIEGDEVSPAHPAS
ncbi:MAG: hypothetical protein WDM76_09010 [Limisphaerales bacterium]